jgi:DAACS family dicarboxylate/amino acid:cation (Na+ or H+) symporter
LACAVVLGLLAHAHSAQLPALDFISGRVLEPLGRLYLRALLLPILPLIFSALVVTLCELDLSQLAKLGRRTLGYTLVLSAFAASLGVLLVNLVRPGEGLAARPLLATDVLNTPSERALGEVLLEWVPSNPLAPLVNGDVLGVVLIAVPVGLALARLPKAETLALRAVMRGLYAVCLRILGWVLAIAPVGIFLLTYSVMWRLGFGALRELGSYVAVVLAGLLILLGVYALTARVFGGLSPVRFFAAIRPALATAFATASSSASFAVALDVAENSLKLPPHVTRFVLSAGATLNQNGTALYEGVTLLFLAQVYGVELGIWQQLGVVGISLAAGLGSVGVPGASAAALAAVASVFGIPAEGVALVLGLDRVLDMCRTTVNVAGDLAAAVFVANGEVAAETQETAELGAQQQDA